MKMYFYKKLKSNETVSLQTCDRQLKASDTFVNITEDEYNCILAELQEKGEAELKIEAEASKTEEQYYIEQLEAENAALLFQLLTGEEYSNV